MATNIREPDGVWTECGQKGGYKTQKKAATPKSCDLLII
jgi:hypothetical protein